MTDDFDLRRADLTDPKETRNDYFVEMTEKYGADSDRVDAIMDQIETHVETIADDHDIEIDDETVDTVHVILLEKILNATDRGNTSLEEHLDRFEEDVKSADAFRGSFTMITGIVAMRADELSDPFAELSRVAHTADGL